MLPMTPSIHNVFSVSISGMLVTALGGGMECMHTCSHFVHLGVVVDSNALLYVFSILLPTDLKWCSHIVHYMSPAGFPLTRGNAGEMLRQVYSGRVSIT